MSDQNDSSESPKHGEFRDLTRLLYRRPPPPTGSPAMAQHFAYRIPDLFAATPNSWLVPVGKFLDDLHDRLSKSDIKNYVPNPVPIARDPNRRYRSARVSFLWRSIPVTLSIEVHREYLTASAVVDLSEWQVDETDSTATDLDSAIRGFDRIALARSVKITNKTPIGRGEDRINLETAHEIIFAKTWERFCDDILKGPLEKIGDELGECFAAGRGFVVSLEGRESANFILLPNHGIRIDRAGPGRPFVEYEAFRCAHTVLPLMRAGHGADALEYSVTQLDANCLYISALGAKPPEWQIAPMATFLLLATHPNPYQLGWMVDRFNDLGVVRRAGLFDLPYLVKAESALRQIEPDLEETRTQRAKETGGKDIASAQFTRDDLSVASASLDKAARGGDGEGRIQGGLPYRVSQSSAYWEQFNQMLGDLRIKPVGDFRAYPELANRRIGDTYGTIAAIGDNYHELMGKISDYNRQLISSELRDVQVKMSTNVDTIAGLQVTIAGLTNASVGQEKTIDEQTTASKKLLENAEWGFWVVLFPYYSSTFLLHNVLGEKKLAAMNGLFDEQLDKFIKGGHAHHLHHDYDLGQLYISAIMLAVGLEGAYKFPVSKALGGIVKRTYVAGTNVAIGAARKISHFRKYATDVLRRKAGEMSAVCRRRKKTIQDRKNQILALLEDRTITKPKERLRRMKDRFWPRGNGP